MNQTTVTTSMEGPRSVEETNQTPARDEPSAPRELTPAAERALKEAAERRARSEAERRDGTAPELGGREGPDPVRYGDWENGGIASDF